MAARRTGKSVNPPTLPKRPKPEITGRTHLVIPDSHASPDHPNHRYDWLGRMIVDLKPDVVVELGDWWELSSVGFHNKPGSRDFEGRRYWADIEAGVDAQERVKAQIDTYNRGRRKKYVPELIRTHGNHEDRIPRLLEAEPRLQGMIGLHDLMSAEFGWREVPYRDLAMIDGIAYTHSLPSGPMGKPIGGMYAAGSLIRLHHHSCVVGHSHLLDYAERKDAAGKRIQALVAGCYFTHDRPWAGTAVDRLLARGIAVLRNVHDGQFDLEWIGIDRVEAKYS